VTSIGTYDEKGNWPRVSSGPNIREFILGSEGNYGVITEAVIKIKRLAEVRKYGSLLFSNFEDGIKFAEEMAMKGVRPASLRLVDNL
jgi:alkyldihydroxyacetonephosphate synthase